MVKAKPVVTAYSSDFHFGHYNYETQRGIITFERTNFNSIQEHDNYLIDTLTKWSLKWGEGSEFWFLGDFGDLSYLWVFDLFLSQGIKCYFMLGNHDHEEDIPTIEKYVGKGNVYKYPIYLSQKLVVSHFPVAVYEDTINICGHLHGAKLKDINHVIASIAVADYKPITDKTLASIYSQLPKFNRHFMYEPWAKDYVFTQPKEDVIMDKSGRIDLSASRMFQKINTERRKQEGDHYQPYAGGLTCDCPRDKQKGL